MIRFATVLIPTCERTRLIKYTLNGLKAQTCKDFEVLLVLKAEDSETSKVAEHYNQFF